MDGIASRGVGARAAEAVVVAAAAAAVELAAEDEIEKAFEVHTSSTASHTAFRSSGSGPSMYYRY